MSYEIGVLKISQISPDNTCTGVSSLKQTLKHRCFPVNKNTFFTEYLIATASFEY